MPRGVRATTEQIEQIIRLTKEGYTQPVIGDKVGLTKETVRSIQKKNNLKASNRWRFGESPIVEIPLAKTNIIKSGTKEQMAKDSSNEWLKIREKAIKLDGSRTGFTYELRFGENFIRVDCGYNEPFNLDLKDIVPFGNELLAVADELMDMKKSINTV